MIAEALLLLAAVAPGEREAPKLTPSRQAAVKERCESSGGVWLEFDADGLKWVGCVWPVGKAE